jgi:hypothetical protein
MIRRLVKKTKKQTEDLLRKERVENTVGNFEELGRKLEYKGYFALGTVSLFPGSMTQHYITAKRKYAQEN